MKLIIAIIMLSGCVTAQPTVQNKLLKRYHDQQDQVYRHSFLLNMNTCFIYYNKCMIHIGNKRKCWVSHEKCVINTNQMYKTVQSKAKERRRHDK